ncbi:uncharacterized protein BO87DRAFT_445198, partial [Aspergillus neoniger CBS 115656]
MPLFVLRIGRPFSPETLPSHSRAINSAWRWIANISLIIMLHNAKLPPCKNPDCNGRHEQVAVGKWRPLALALALALLSP